MELVVRYVMDGVRVHQGSLPTYPDHQLSRDVLYETNQSHSQSHRVESSPC